MRRAYIDYFVVIASSLQAIALQVAELPAEQKPYLVAHIQAPDGIRQLSQASLR